MIYAQETVELIPGKFKEYQESLEQTQIPLYHDLGYRLVAAWETVSSQGHWPEVLTLWEIDDYLAYGRILKAQYTPGPLASRFRDLQDRLGSVATHTQGRMMTPSSGTPTLEQIKQSGRNAKVCVHETIQTTPRKSKEYAEQCQRLWEPVASRYGRWMLGVYAVAWRNAEAVNIWALDDWETIGTQQVPLRSDPATHSWSEIAISLRQDWHDRLLSALPCSPI